MTFFNSRFIEIGLSLVHRKWRIIAASDPKKKIFEQENFNEKKIWTRRISFKVSLQSNIAGTFVAIVFFSYYVDVIWCVHSKVF